ncbi:hypothetical protein Vretimale_10238 [Volvox reticuliferus]|uniref:glycerophosphodiester phosphodiesterase n=1 Tax=Volvox reticuliferus TaxID=1737510 RepID=A0A8J4GE33_9CHLO|nr:hypothetical protein Vretifemale_721 [Volvox reticuliferus]GIM05767.1 hypothetical protein Vretimale_10238 [Volvox reticuliferus]
MKSNVRFPSPVAGKAGLQQLELVIGVPFASRAEAIRTQPSPRPRTQHGLFRAFLAVIAVSVATTILIVWYMRHELPVAQKRAKESEALLAPPSQSFCRRTRPPMVCAHGGDTTHAPPNTVSAFQASLDGGADCVEVDAALSRDGVLVVMHVRELAQLLGRGGVQVGDLTARELLSLRWPSGEAVMSVEEAVRLTSPFVSCVTLDVKTYNDKAGQPLDELAIAEALVGLVAATHCTNCLIWAKSDRVVRRVLELSPGQRTGYIVMNETEESRQLGMYRPLRFSAAQAAANGAHVGGSVVRAPDPLPLTHGSVPTSGEGGDGWVPLGEDAGSGGGSGSGLPPSPIPVQPAGWRLQPAVVGVHFAMAEPQLLEQLHGAGKQMFVWTINQAEVLRAVLDVGVDALVTNYPLTALAAIESRLAKCGAVQAAAVQAAVKHRHQPLVTTGDYL